MFATAPVAAETLPDCDSLGTADAAFFGVPNAAPRVDRWQNATVDLGEPCTSNSARPFELIVTLTGRFKFLGSLEDMAARFGAVSTTAGLRYWSVTSERWRPLISEGFAVKGPSDTSKRSDFGAEEVLAGHPVYFLQDDTRSTGRNLYVMQARRITPDVLVVETRNVRRIRLFVATVFAAESLYSLHYLRRIAPGQWGYFGVSAARALPPTSSERSFINRAAAFYHYLAGIPSDTEPPLAP